MRRRSLILLLAVVGLSSGRPLAAPEIRTSAVRVGGTEAALLVPPKPRGSLILLIGGPGRVDVTPDGQIGKGRLNQLARTRADYARRGFAVLVPNAGYDLAALVASMGQISRPVTVVATSRGTKRAAQGLAAGARPDRLVLTSGFLSDASGDRENVESILRNPALLPPTLVIHHVQDACRKTLPAGVEPFIAWSQGRARAQWMQGGRPEGDPCEAQALHGFNGLDDKVVAAVAAFAGR